MVFARWLVEREFVAIYMAAAYGFRNNSKKVE